MGLASPLATGASVSDGHRCRWRARPSHKTRWGSIATRLQASQSYSASGHASRSQPGGTSRAKRKGGRAMLGCSFSRAGTGSGSAARVRAARHYQPADATLGDAGPSCRALPSRSSSEAYSSATCRRDWRRNKDASPRPPKSSPGMGAFPLSDADQSTVRLVLRITEDQRRPTVPTAASSGLLHSIES